MMKTMKTVLLATATLTSVSSAVHAEDLAGLKDLIAAITSNDVYSTAAVQVPRGYVVSPTADASAADEAAAVEEPFVEVKTSGYIKAGYIYSQIKDTPPAPSSGSNPAPKDESQDFDAEGGVNVKGSVQSSLGEVGVTIQAKWDIAESVGNLSTIALRDDGLIGFWQFADTMKLEMGRGNGGRFENGVDKNTRRIWTIGNRRVRSENAGNGFFDRDMYNGFLGLAYASGPITVSVRAHDATRGVLDSAKNAGYDDDAIGVSAKVTYSGEQISLEASGGYWGEDDASTLAPKYQTGVKWLAGVGTELDFISGLPISLGVQTGELHNGTKMLKVSGSTSVALSDTINVGVGAGWTKISNEVAGTSASTSYGTLVGFSNHIERVVTGGIYYTPMSYLTLGAEADWYDDGLAAAYSNDGYTAAFVTRYAF